MDENKNRYYYQKNIQGDVIGIYSKDYYDNFVCEAYYVYDAFGNHKIYDDDWNENTSPSFIGNINPIRYRSYYYDVETGFYYLETRYYDPELCRFISPDNTKYLEPATLGGLNLYAYCNNNPVMYADPSGNFFITAMIVGAVIGAAIGFGLTAYADYSDDGEIFNGSISATGYIANTVVGGVIGGAIGAFAGGAGASIGNAVSSFLSSSYSFAMPNLVSGGALVLGQVTGAQIAGVAAGVAGVVMFAKHSSGPIRFSDGTGIDPDTGSPVTDPKRAEEIYKRLTDPKLKNNWKKWMKGKGWRHNHIKP